jgi:hypothetical protein
MALRLSCVEAKAPPGPSVLADVDELEQVVLGTPIGVGGNGFQNDRLQFGITDRLRLGVVGQWRSLIFIGKSSAGDVPKGNV